MCYIITVSTPAYPVYLVGRVYKLIHTTDFNNSGINKYRVETNSFNDRRNWNFNREPDPDKIRNARGRNITTVNTQSENVKGGKRDLTRVRIMDGNRQNDASPRPGDNQNNFTPPPVGRERPKQQELPNKRSDIEDRNMNNPPQNNQPAKSRDNLNEPKHPDEKPAVRKNEPDRNRKNDNSPPAEKEKSQQPEKQTDRLNNGDRNMNNPPQNNQPTKTRDNLIEPKHTGEKPALRSNEQDRKDGEQKIERKKESSQQVIRNYDSSKTKSQVIKIQKKQEDNKKRNR